MNDNLVFDLKLKIAKALMFGLDVSQFINQLIEIENELGNNFKASRISSQFFDRQFLNNSEIDISISMIVKNESKTLQSTLESIKNIADEIIIVDTGSTDNTIEIAKNYTDKIYHLDWANDFSFARNYSLDKCVGNWVMYIDADEVLTEQSAKQFRNTIKLAGDNDGLLITKIINYGLDDNGKKIEYIGQYPRIFRNIGFPLVHFFGRIHEQIGPSLINFDYEMKNTNLELIHSGYFRSKEEMNTKVKRNLQTLSDHIQEDSSNGYTWYQLGNTLYQMQEYAKSIDILENALKCNNMSDFLNSNTCLALSNAYYKIKNNNKAIEKAKESLKYNPKNQVAEIMLTNLLKLN